MPSVATKVCFLLATFFGFSVICSFNSQEHKIIADVGISRVTVPVGLVFPQGIRLVSTTDYLSNWQNAKMLAVGFSTNNENDYNDQKLGVQDNAYWTNYGQATFNKKNYIEMDTKPWPLLNFTIDAYVGNKKEAFTFGDLVAIYGDYRRTVYADNQGDCYLTNDNNSVVNFTGNRGGQFAPAQITTSDYLHSIGFGLCPPYGAYGNIGSNTARDDQYDEAGWWGDEMMRIANVNDTHFSNVAMAWYIGMHRMALKYAVKAIANPQYWKTAFHCEADALHSLTDLFALGHAVTNRDESSYGGITKHGLLKNPTFLWMESIIKMGGGTRDGNGIVSLAPYSPATTAELMKTRKDFAPTYLSTWAWWGKAEHDYHDYFNNSGATVRNFNGDKFQVYGDYKLHDLDRDSRRVIENAVTASVQSLLNCYDAVKNGRNGELLMGQDSSLFSALRYVPVFIEKDENNYFNGRWILYAGVVNSLLERGSMPSGWEDCRIPFLSGKDYGWPYKYSSPCATF